MNLPTLTTRDLTLPKTIMIDGKWVSDVMHIATRGPKGWSDRPAKKDETK